MCFVPLPSSPHRRRHRGARYRVPWHERGGAFGRSRVRCSSREGGSVAALSTRIARMCMGDDLVLRTHHAGDRARTSGICAAGNVCTLVAGSTSGYNRASSVSPTVAFVLAWRGAEHDEHGLDTVRRPYASVLAGAGSGSGTPYL